MHIQDIPRDEDFKIRYSELAYDANMYEDGRFFHAISDGGGEWCCIGVVVDHADNIDNPDPWLQVNGVYRKAGSSNTEHTDGMNTR